MRLIGGENTAQKASGNYATLSPICGAKTWHACQKHGISHCHLCSHKLQRGSDRPTGPSEPHTRYPMRSKRSGLCVRVDMKPLSPTYASRRQMHNFVNTKFRDSQDIGNPGDLGCRWHPCALMSVCASTGTNPLRLQDLFSSPHVPGTSMENSDENSPGVLLDSCWISGRTGHTTHACHTREIHNRSVQVPTEPFMGGIRLIEPKRSTPAHAYSPSHTDSGSAADTKQNSPRPGPRSRMDVMQAAHAEKKHPLPQKSDPEMPVGHLRNGVVGTKTAESRVFQNTSNKTSAASPHTHTPTK